MRKDVGRSRHWRRVPRALAVVDVSLAGVAIVGGWIGFGWRSGPAAIGAVGALLLAFAAFTGLPAATDGDVGKHVPVPTGSPDGT